MNFATLHDWTINNYQATVSLTIQWQAKNFINKISQTPLIRNDNLWLPLEFTTLAHISIKLSWNIAAID